MGQESLLTPKVCLGRLGAPFGVRGWIYVHSYTEPLDNILRYRSWELPVGTVQVKDGRIHKGRVVVLLEGYESRDAVEALRNHEVFVSRSALPELEEGQYYWSDLVGLQVVDEHQQHLGTVKSVFATGSNDVLVVQGEEEVLIPFILGDAIIQVDLSEGFIHVRREQVM